MAACGGVHALECRHVANMSPTLQLARLIRAPAPVWSKGVFVGETEAQQFREEISHLPENSNWMSNLCAFIFIEGSSHLGALQRWARVKENCILVPDYRFLCCFGFLGCKTRTFWALTAAPPGSLTAPPLSSQHILHPSSLLFH